MEGNARICADQAAAEKSGRALPVHHEGDPHMLLRVEAQRVRRPAAPA